MPGGGGRFDEVRIGRRSDEMIQVRTAIPEYAGHADVQARRLADQQVRAWVGERLAALRERLPIPGDLAAAFEDLLMRCQFGDQRVIKTLDDARFADPEHVAALEAEDAKLLTLAADADRVDAAGLPALVAALRTAFDDRTAAIVGLGLKR
jgi:hypothetical protein